MHKEWVSIGYTSIDIFLFLVWWQLILGFIKWLLMGPCFGFRLALSGYIIIFLLLFSKSTHILCFDILLLLDCFCHWFLKSCHVGSYWCEMSRTILSWLSYIELIILWAHYLFNLFNFCFWFGAALQFDDIQPRSSYVCWL